MLEGARAGALHVDTRVRAQHAHGNLLAGHLQAEHGDGFVFVRGVGRDVDGKAGLAHAGAGADQHQLAAMQAGEQAV